MPALLMSALKRMAQSANVLIGLLLVAGCVHGALLVKTCDAATGLYPHSCSPKWCVRNNVTSCGAVDATPIGYTSFISSVACKQCTQSTASQCSSSALASTLKASGSHVKAAYCNDHFLIIHSDGQPNHRAFLEYIPTSSGSGGSAPGVNSCRTQTKVDQFQSYKVPLSYTLLDLTTSNNASFPTVAELSRLGAVGVAINGLPIFASTNQHGADFWEACEADLCNAHVGKGGDYHYHGDPYGSRCLYSDADYVNNHPVQWGWGLDGPSIYGRYTADSQDGAFIALDECGGHSHGSYGYHYHSFVEDRVTTDATPGLVAGLPYTAYAASPAKCWRGDVSRIPNFWMGQQVAYDNSKTAPQPYILSARTDYEQLRPCCGSTAFYAASGVTINGAVGSGAANSVTATAASAASTSSTAASTATAATTTTTAATTISSSPAASAIELQVGSLPSGQTARKLTQAQPPAPVQAAGAPPAASSPSSPSSSTLDDLKWMDHACFFLPKTSADATTSLPCDIFCDNGATKGQPQFPSGMTFNYTVLTSTTSALWPSGVAAWDSWKANFTSGYLFAVFYATLPVNGVTNVTAQGLKLPTSSIAIYNTANAGGFGNCGGRYANWQASVTSTGYFFKVCAMPANATVMGSTSLSPPPPSPQSSASTQSSVLVKTCETATDLYPNSCSPNWCVWDNMTSCTFPTTTISYASYISSLTCKQCTQSTSLQCSSSALASMLKTSGSHVKAAYCNDYYLVIHSDGQPTHRAFLEYIPTPPGSGGEAPGDNTCRTRSKVDQFQSYKVPLNYSLLDLSASNNASFPTGVELTTQELPKSGAMGVAVNGLPIYPSSDDHEAQFWEACEADYCNAHVGKGGDYHYHGDPYGSSCLYTDSDYVNNHPVLWGWGLDGPAIYGRYTADSQDGASIALDKCGGHSHGSYGYHYHSFVENRVAVIPTPSSKKGLSYTAYQQSPAKCWRGDISKIANFWMGQQVAYDNSKTAPQPYILSARTDYEQLRPCCGSTDYYVASGIVINGASNSPSTSASVPSSPSPPPSKASQPVDSGTDATSASASVKITAAVIKRIFSRYFRRVN